MKTVTQFNKHKRRFDACCFALKSPSLLLRGIKAGIKYVYETGVQSPFHTITLDELIDAKTQVHLDNFCYRAANSTYFEKLVICSLLSRFGSKRVLEIGTFDGNTTFQMALNTPDNAVIHTLDLPYDNPKTKLPTLESDVWCIESETKRNRRFLHTPQEKKIVQHYGDSTTYDFQKFGLIDFAFIDGGHSYECVKSDTEKTLPILDEKAIVIWHDFISIHTYLKQLARTLPIHIVKGADMAIYFKNTL
ncbi:MAG: class I SAM-dependent methyltransferase [Chlamydiales bacterium]|nr:class I SAM-dependent methyltransferase [Chlamydiales bacterium]